MITIDEAVSRLMRTFDQHFADRLRACETAALVELGAHDLGEGHSQRFTIFPDFYITAVNEPSARAPEQPLELSIECGDIDALTAVMAQCRELYERQRPDVERRVRVMAERAARELSGASG